MEGETGMCVCTCVQRLMYMYVYVHVQSDWGVSVEGKMRGWCAGRDRCVGVQTGMQRWVVFASVETEMVVRRVRQGMGLCI